MYDSSFGWRFVNKKMEEIYGADGMGVTAENLVEKYGIDRESQDAFALWSQQKVAQGIKNRFFDDEITSFHSSKEKRSYTIFSG